MPDPDTEPSGGQIVARTVLAAALIGLGGWTLREFLPALVWATILAIAILISVFAVLANAVLLAVDRRLHRCTGDERDRQVGRRGTVRPELRTEHERFARVGGGVRIAGDAVGREAGLEQVVADVVFAALDLVVVVEAGEQREGERGHGARPEFVGHATAPDALPGHGAALARSARARQPRTHPRN